MENGAAELNPAVAPLNELLDTYSECLSLSRGYVEHSLAEEADPDGDMDVDSLQLFLAARADLFAAAESSFSTLSACPKPAEEEPERKELTQRVIAVLEEMAEMETKLTDFLHDRLGKMHETINHMKKSEPVFKRYGNLGGHIHPSRITRHE